MRRVILSLFLAACTCGAAHAAEWPKVSAGSAPECAQALAIAKAMFESRVFFMYAPPPRPLPAEVKDALVIQPHEFNLGAGDALDIDDKVFDKKAIEGGELNTGGPSYYWEKEPRFGHRLVIAEERIGWRGDMYFAFSIDEKMTREDFVQKLTSGDRRRNLPPLVEENWRPPLVFAAKDPAGTWLIDVGQPFETLGPWRVFRNEAGGFKPVCAIEFRPKAKSAVGLLPPPVRKLESLLDSTMGSGKDEGTLQPTAQVRLDVQHTWANVAIRPWAIKDQAYNTREQVDAGLRRWSKLGPKAREIHDEIQRAYPVAEEALARYYRDSLHMSPEDAKGAAARSMDVAYRSHYVFPSSP